MIETFSVLKLIRYLTKMNICYIFPVGQRDIPDPGGEELDERRGADGEGVVRRLHQVHPAGDHRGQYRVCVLIKLCA